MTLNFSDKYIAFLDILGFQDILSSLDYKEKLERSFDIIEKAIRKNTSKSDHGIYPAEDIQITSLSDSIVLSIDVPDGNCWQYRAKSIRYLLSAIERIQFDLSLEDIWLRGGISKGFLSHDKNVVGQGLVNAYNLEQQAIYPRVLVDSSIIEDIKEDDKEETRKDLVNKINQTFSNPEYRGRFVFDWEYAQAKNEFIHDYPFFINYMNCLLDEDKEELRKKIARILIERLSSNRPKIYRKYRWVCDYIHILISSEINRRVELQKGYLEDDKDFAKRKETSFLEKYCEKLHKL